MVSTQQMHVARTTSLSQFPRLPSPLPRDGNTYGIVGDFLRKYLKKEDKRDHLRGRKGQVEQPETQMIH